MKKFKPIFIGFIICVCCILATLTMEFIGENVSIGVAFAVNFPLAVFFLFCLVWAVIKILDAEEESKKILSTEDYFILLEDGVPVKDLLFTSRSEAQKYASVRNKNSEVKGLDCFIYYMDGKVHELHAELVKSLQPIIQR